MIFNLSNVHFFIAILSFTFNLVFIKSDNALLFDWYENTLVQNPSKDDESENVCMNCASARTASNSEESEFNYEKSVGKKALFVDDIFNQPEYMKNIRPRLSACKRSVQPSFVYNTDRGQIQTGYEISRTVIPEGRRETLQSFPSRYTNEELDEFLSLYPSDPKQEPNPKDVLSKYMDLLSKRMAPEIKNSQVFIWIPILSINFNMDTLSPIQIEHHADLGLHLWRENCRTFDVGKEFYKKISFDFFYSDENQKTLLRDFENLPTPSPKLEPISSDKKYKCGQKYGCFVRHQIIPSYFFHSDYGARAICTLMNTVPIWEGIVERINTVDRYLYAMAQIWGLNIRLKNGFFGILESPGINYKKISLYLDQEDNNIPVPKIFYKIVEYKVNVLPRGDRLHHYYAVIVIHNDPFVDASKQRICEQEKTVEGWEDIQNTEPLSGLTYVCEFNPEVAYKLKYIRRGSVQDEIPLKLNDFPTFDTIKRKYLYEDKTPEIRNKIKELFGQKEV